jgi:hypothetical protein
MKAICKTLVKQRGGGGKIKLEINTGLDDLRL